MPDTETKWRPGMALALSGGGFRATLFHCGTLIRLNEMGFLSRFARISSVSGGSITAGMLASRWAELTLVDGVFTDLGTKVIEPLRAFCRRRIDTAAVAWGSFLPGRSIGDVLADAYDELFARPTPFRLRDLPTAPTFVFNATNLQTGRLVRMQKSRIADYTIGEIPDPDLRLAVAVAASSAFPPVLSPVTIACDPARWVKLEGAVHHGDPNYTRELSLTDGGAYDNLGLETVDTFTDLVVSDAGAPFGVEESADTLWPKQLMRALDIATDQARGLRKRMLFQRDRTKTRFAYAGIDTDANAYPAPRRLGFSPAITDPLARIRTRLDPFSDQEQGRLINWGWYLTDLATRSNLAPDAAAPERWSVPAHPLA